MKKLLGAVICTAAIVLSYAGTVSASVEYNLKELDMKITAPSELITFTRDIDVTDPNLEILDTTGTKLYNDLLFDNVYLYQSDESLTSNLLVRMIETEESLSMFDFSSYTDEELSALIAASSEALNSTIEGFNLTDKGIQTIGDNKYYIVDYQGTNKYAGQYQRRYLTAKNGKFISVTAGSTQKSKFVSMCALAEPMLQSMSFSQILPMPGGEVVEDVSEPITKKFTPTDMSLFKMTFLLVCFVWFMFLVLYNISFGIKKRKIDTTSAAQDAI